MKEVERRRIYSPDHLYSCWSVELALSEGLRRNLSWRAVAVPAPPYFLGRREGGGGREENRGRATLERRCCCDRFHSHSENI